MGAAKEQTAAKNNAVRLIMLSSCKELCCTRECWHLPSIHIGDGIRNPRSKYTGREIRHSVDKTVSHQHLASMRTPSAYPKYRVFISSSTSPCISLSRQSRFAPTILSDSNPLIREVSPSIVSLVEAIYSLYDSSYCAGE